MDDNDRAITRLLMVAHGMVHTYELSIPIFLSIWLTEFDVIDLGIIEIAVTTASLGAVVAAGYGLFGVGALPGGLLVDRYGSRRLVVACLVGMAGSFLLLGVAPSVLAISIALVLWGTAASVYHPAGLSLISKGVHERGTGFAYHGIAGNVGIGLGPLVVVVLLIVLDWRAVALLLAVPAVVAAWYATRAEFDETAAIDAEASADGGSRVSTQITSLPEFLDVSKRLVTGRFALVFVVVICSGLYYRGVLTFLPELLEGMPGFEPIPLAAVLPAPVLDLLGESAGVESTVQPERYFYAALLTVGVVGQYVGGKITDRIPVEYSLVGGFGTLAVLAVLFLPVAALGVVPTVLVGVVLGVFLFLVQPVYQAAVAEYTPAGTRGLSYGYTYLGVFGVGSLGAIVAGTVLAYSTPPVLFTTLAGFAFVATVVGLYLARGSLIRS